MVDQPGPVGAVAAIIGDPGHLGPRVGIELDAPVAFLDIRKAACERGSEVLDESSGKDALIFVDVARQFGVDKGVRGPDDLVFHPNGESFYFTDILTGHVGRMDLQGNLMGYQFVAPGVNPVTFSDDGRLFVALDFQGDGLYELDPNLADTPTPIVPYVANTFPLGFLNAFDFGQAQARLDDARANVMRSKYDYIFRLKILEFYFRLPIQLN